jgi:hypothetical protein
MTVARLSEMGSDPRKAQAAQRTALVTQLVTSKRARAVKIASLDGAVNSSYATFKNPTQRFTRASMQKVLSRLENIRSQVASARRSALKDMACTIASRMPNKGVIAQYEDCCALSAKLAALIVTAKVSLDESVTDNPADQPLEDHDIVTIDSNGYVADDNMDLDGDPEVQPVAADDETPGDDDLSVASGDDEDVVPVDDEPGPMDVSSARNAKKTKAGFPDVDKGAPLSGAPVAGKKKADVTDEAPIDPAPDAKPAKPASKAAKPLPEFLKNKKAGIKDGGPAAPLTKAPGASDVSEQTYPLTPGNTNGSDQEDPDQDTPVDAKPGPTPEGARKAGRTAEPETDELDGELPETDETADVDNDGDLDGELDEAPENNEALADQLDLPDSGIDEALQAEILDDDFAGDDDESADEGIVEASSKVRSGKAMRNRRLATATRTDTRASEDNVLSALASDIF